MSDGSVGRNEKTENAKFLLLLNNRVSVFTQYTTLNIQSKCCVACEHYYSQANYEFMFILSDTKNGKNAGRFDNYG